MTRGERRAAMPFTSSLIDDHRKHFGEPNGIKATENNHKVQWRKTFAEGRIKRESRGFNNQAPVQKHRGVNKSRADIPQGIRVEK